MNEMNEHGIPMDLVKRAVERLSKVSWYDFEETERTHMASTVTPAILHELARQEAHSGLPGYGATDDLGWWILENPDHEALLEMMPLKVIETPLSVADDIFLSALKDRVRSVNLGLALAKRRIWG